VRKNEDFDEFYLIATGGVNVLYSGDTSRSDSKKKIFIELIELPTNSYFGEYQILLNLNSTFVYMSNEGEDTTMMCLATKKFLELLKEYPNVKEHWVKQATARRREFRRLTLKSKEALQIAKGSHVEYNSKKHK
jgi:signal-transduction protein with cAMP-binding, CBS, and nucleotidyltransferase domain